MQAHGEVLTNLLTAWEKRDAEQFPSLQDLGKLVTPAVRLAEEGFVVDFRAVKRLFLWLVTAELEGKDLDGIFEYPTAENLSKWIWAKLTAFFPLYSVEVREKPHSSAIYFGKD